MDRAPVPRRPARSRRVRDARRTGGTRPFVVQARTETTTRRFSEARCAKITRQRSLPRKEQLGMAWIRTIPREDATGTLKEAYDWQAKRLGEPTEFTQLGSLYPELVMQRLHLYKTVEACPSGLSPVERQLAAL